MGDSGIGSVYSPPKEESGESPVVTRRRHVETVIDIGYRREVSGYWAFDPDYLCPESATTGLVIEVRKGGNSSCSDELVWE
jgi:hypothetical protein